MVCSHSFVGVAPGEAAQSRGDGVGSGSSRRRPSRQRLEPGWSQPVAEEGLPGRRPAAGETPERRLWAYQARSSPGGLPGAPQKGSLPDGFPQRRTGAIEEAPHPTAFASCIVVFTTGFRAADRKNRLGAALSDLHVAALIASLQLPTQPQFHANRLAPHPRWALGRAAIW